MPMNRDLYPDNWEQMAFAIKQAANWTCEGCGRPCIRPDETVPEFVERITTELPIWLVDDPATHSRRFLLSVAHLDHQPQNCDRANLRAWCCPCHCRYDIAQMGRKKQLKRERHGQLTLADIPPPPPQKLSGDQLSFLPNIKPYPINPNHPPEICSGGNPSGSLSSASFSSTASPFQSPTPLPLTPPIPSKPKLRTNRRHTPKGRASGWIEQRTGNRHRKQATLSHYYLWDSPKGRVTEYIRASRLTRIQQLIAQGHPALEILRTVTQGKRLSGLTATLLTTPSPAQKPPFHLNPTPSNTPPPET